MAARLGMDAPWIEAGVLDVRAADDGHFDLVDTSIGTITWLPDV